MKQRRQSALRKSLLCLSSKPPAQSRTDDCDLHKDELIRRVDGIIQDEMLSLQQLIHLSLRQDLRCLSMKASLQPSRSRTAETIKSEASEAFSRVVSADESENTPRASVQKLSIPFTFDSGPRALAHALQSHRGESIGEPNGTGESQHLLTEEVVPQVAPRNSKWEDTFATSYLQRQSNSENTWLCCTLCASFVQSENFELLSSAFIIVNCFLIAFQVDYMTNHDKDELPPYLTFAKHLMCLIFAMEVFLRVATYRSTYCGFVGRNIIDSAAIVFTFVEEFNRLRGCYYHSHILAGLSVLRIARIFRVIRIIRKIKLLVLLGQLRVLIVSITDSMGSLIWAFVAIGLVTFLVAVILVSFLKQRLRDHHMLSEEDREVLMQHFGSVEGAMLTLYEVALDGIHWSVPLDLLMNSCPGYLSIIFIAYTTLSRIAVMNIVTSIFVTSAMKLADADKKMILQTKMLSFFHDADVDKDGTINWEEFTAQAEHPIMVEFFEELDIDPKHARHVYDSLDIDKSGNVDIDELVKGMANIHNRILATGLMTASSS